MTVSNQDNHHGSIKAIALISCLFQLFVSLYIFLWPGSIVVTRLLDPGIRNDKVPSWVTRHYRRIAPRYGNWAQERVQSKAAASLSTSNIAGTEWPIFGTVFFLWTSEELTKQGLISPESPEIRDAVDAALNLVLDPNHAGWVKKHWGEEYMYTENAFYRLLRISAMVSHHTITGDTAYLPMLRKETLALMEDIDTSPTGLIDDYPGECYPCDVLVAVASIKRASSILEINSDAFVERSLRAFQGDALDARGMLPYFADARKGVAIGPSRGCSNSYISLSAPDVHPDLAKTWYDLYESNFWQHKWGASGFREFPKDMTGREWYFDVDAGPVVAGHGFAASAFGIGAARANGRLDHAFPLSCELIVFSWPLPHGTLYVPTILSDSTDAPYLGEVAILYSLSRTAKAPITLPPDSKMPPIVYAMIGLYFVPGFILLAIASWRLKTLRSGKVYVTCAPAQRIAWAVLAVLALICFVNMGVLGLLLGLLASTFPFFKNSTA